MYTILTTGGQRVAIFAAHVSSVELKDDNTVCTVIMTNGTQYVAAMQGELIIKGIMDILQSAVR